ncbi:folylpolyglutamate synthase [Amphichorda felina]
MPRAQDVSNALSRIRGVLSTKKEAEKATRDIRLGLERITRVLPEVQEWQGVHVGGTNGKGSICAFLSGFFTLAGIGHGRYVSPAFPEKHNAVSINGRYVDPRVYEKETRHVEAAYKKLMRGWRFAASETPGPLSPFELETATAFRLFDKYHVPYGIVEVGMGGATDATNAMRRKAVTVISKIDLDHQEYLGNTVEEIAKVKAGIMRPGVPCIVDHTNDNSVIQVLRQHASSIGTQISLTWKAEPFLKTLNNDWWQLEDYQKQNLLCAALAFRHLFPLKEINLDRLLEMDPYLPGRMEWVEISRMAAGRYKPPVLVDAAHNMLGVQALGRYTDSRLRADDKPITWVMGFSSSKTKPFAKMIETLVKPQDNIAFVEFDRQDNEPPATPASVGRDVAKTIVNSPDQVYAGEPDIQSAIEWASSKVGSGHLVVTGSLYLVRDLYKLDGVDRFRETEPYKPGTSQLWQYSKMWRQRPLSREEYETFTEAKKLEYGSQIDAATKKAEHNGEPSSLPDNAGLETEGTHTESQAPDLIDPVEAALHSDRQPPPPNVQGVKELSEKAARHRHQSNTYRSAQRCIEEDIDNESGSTSEVISKLRESIGVLRAQADHHQETYNQTIDELRNHPDAPRQYALIYSKLFGRKSVRTPFHQRTELDVAKPLKEKPQPVEASAPAPEPVDKVKRDFWGRPEGIDEPPDFEEFKKEFMKRKSI